MVTLWYLLNPIEILLIPYVIWYLLNPIDVTLKYLKHQRNPQNTAGSPDQTHQVPSGSQAQVWCRHLQLQRYLGTSLEPMEDSFTQLDESWLTTGKQLVNCSSTWGCVKIGYIQNYSHLIGIMISKTIGFRGTLFSDTPTCCPSMSSSSDMLCLSRCGTTNWRLYWRQESLNTGARWAIANLANY